MTPKRVSITLVLKAPDPLASTGKLWAGGKRLTVLDFSELWSSYACTNLVKIHIAGLDWAGSALGEFRHYLGRKEKGDGLDELGSS